MCGCRCVSALDEKQQRGPQKAIMHAAAAAMSEWSTGNNNKKHNILVFFTAQRRNSGGNKEFFVRCNSLLCCSSRLFAQATLFANAAEPALVVRVWHSSNLLTCLCGEDQIFIIDGWGDKLEFLHRNANNGRRVSVFFASYDQICLLLMGVKFLWYSNYFANFIDKWWVQGQYEASNYSFSWDIGIGFYITEQGQMKE